MGVIVVTVAAAKVARNPHSIYVTANKWQSTILQFQKKNTKHWSCMEGY